ncbi:hypothetical protein IAQ61_001856 [Plenodomus lingam]|uniref:uncharacterized protein n=1 Tax=Leptosphaeria maculans TaxID=5022 RepID=UPI003320BCC0|nr:hypothetical protein IAQ61_001856 [Plenodomus lingam]
MKVSNFLVLGIGAATSTAAFSDDSLFASLLKRQEPGSAAYNCHDNCAVQTGMGNATASVIAPSQTPPQVSTNAATAISTNKMILRAVVLFGGAMIVL